MESKELKKIEHNFIMGGKITHTSAEFPPKTKKSLIKFSKSFHKELEEISYDLPKGSLLMVDEKKEEEIRRLAKAYCPKCGKHRSTMYRKNIPYNTVNGQTWCQKHFLENE